MATRRPWFSRHWGTGDWRACVTIGFVPTIGCWLWLGGPTVEVDLLIVRVSAGRYGGVGVDQW